MLYNQTESAHVFLKNSSKSTEQIGIGLNCVVLNSLNKMKKIVNIAPFVLSQVFRFFEIITT